MNTILKTETKKYKGVFYRIAEDGSSYEVFEVAPLMKTEVCFASGASCKETYTDEYVKEVIDKAVKDMVPSQTEKLIYDFVKTEYDEVLNEILGIPQGDKMSKEEADKHLKQRINEFVEREI